MNQPFISSTAQFEQRAFFHPFPFHPPFFPRRRFFPFFFLSPFFFPFFRTEGDQRNDWYHTHHVCRDGDTLEQISKQHNVPGQIIVMMNPHIQNFNVLSAGEQVGIPKMHAMHCQTLYSEQSPTGLEAQGMPCVEGFPGQMNAAGSGGYPGMMNPMHTGGSGYPGMGTHTAPSSAGGHPNAHHPYSKRQSTEDLPHLYSTTSAQTSFS